MQPASLSPPTIPSMSLTRHIKHDLMARIDRGEALADLLTLERLSDHYNVSLTPVRIAVTELIDEGFLQRSTNRRLVITKRRGRQRQPKTKQPDPLQTFETHFATVTQDLIEQSLKGISIILREEATARKYNVSRATIRQIFHRLAGDGIIVHLPRRGWRLRPFKEADLDAYIEFRVMVERMALNLAKHRLVRAELQEMLAANRIPTRSSERPQPDARLHTYLIKRSQNPFIADFFDRHGKYFERLFEWEALDYGAALQAVQQHRGILEALITGDWEAAGNRLEDHIRNNHSVLRSLLSKQQETPQ